MALSSHPEYLSHPKYRPDIDGLRAIAVLAVVGFHAFPLELEGGFIGVDIFFVISGYLISTIIIGNLEQNSFSFIEFYSRRIKRIFPALFLVLTACFAIGWFILLADEYKQLGKHLTGGAGFISNFMFWNEAGYFDNAAETKPLLHLWSLGIEEQFYILWPLLMWLAWKKRFSLQTIAIVVAAISFGFNILYAHSAPTAAFYSPQARFWELMAGSILAYMALRRSVEPQRYTGLLNSLPSGMRYPKTPELNIRSLGNVQSLLGALLIVIGFFLITKESYFPGWWAVLPTFGTVLIISASAQAWINRTVLSNRVLVWFGLISFPLYLWHWPLLSFARIIEGESPSLEARWAIILASILLAWMTYWLVEKPVRFGRYGKEKTTILVLLMIIIGSIGYSTYARDGLAFRAPLDKSLTYQAYSKSIVRTDKEKECFDIPYAFEKNGDWFCKLGDKTIRPSLFAYGDSHALSLIPAIHKFGVENGRQILFSGSSGCPPLLGVQSLRGAEWRKKYNCQRLNERIFEYVRDNRIESVLLIARWTYYSGGAARPKEINHISMNEGQEATYDFSRASFEYGLQQTIKKYEEIGVRIYIVEDVPQQIYDPKDAMKKSKLNDASINKLSVTLKEHKNHQSWVSDQFRKTVDGRGIAINFDSALCGHDLCSLVSQGKFLYFDDDHLSVEGARLAYPSLAKALTTH